MPGTVTVHTATEAEARGARDLKDLFRHEVDLVVRQQPGRYTAAGSNLGRAGNEGLNVRGLEGNQVLVLVDGVRAPQAFGFGAFASGRLDTLFTEALATAEVLRGPASAQFGSDGLAGALSLRTLAPADLLRPGQARAGFVRGSQHSVDEGAALTGAASTAAETQTAQTAQTAQTPPAPAAAPPVSAHAPRAAAPSAPARVHQVAEHRQCQSAPYPAVLRERGIQGELRLRVHVGPDGQAAAVQLVASSGWRLFDEAALAQARGCRFRPAIEGDKPVAAWVEFPVRFSLGG